jgi:4'-phosphopantetheinyl transferase EntD
VITGLVPALVAAHEEFGDPPGLTLFPAEDAALGTVVEQRRREYTTVRWCARRALAGIGLPPAPVVPGVRGAPGWPAGVVGSMTHCAGYRAAAVARTADACTVGIDAEPHEPLPDGVLAAIATPAEAAHVADLLRTHPRVRWDRMLFSAKESVYKAWFPLTGRWLGFADADIVFDPAGTFTARLLVDAPVVGGRRPVGFAGRWACRGDLLATAIAGEPSGAVSTVSGDWLVGGPDPR